MPLPFTIASLRELYRTGAVTVEQVLDEALRRAADPRHPQVWITLLERERLLEMAARLSPDLPLYGVPFAIKDNIDLAGVSTTCACPDFAYIPTRSATVVERLMAAGAIPLGKTNLDQFATGLVGVRSPYGAPQSVFNPEYLSGGSSSGSAVAVASGMVAFALGTDTAGSGRVPAGFNHIVGLKPSLGALSTRGVFPACRALDCVSIFAGTCGEAQAVFEVAAAFDAEEPYSRVVQPARLPSAPRFGVPAAELLEFFGDDAAREVFHAAARKLEELGATRVEIDFAPFRDTAKLLYAGPWTAERRHALGRFFEEKPESIDPTVRGIVGGADRFNAVQTFDGFYRLQALAALARREWEKMDLLLLPTSGTTYRIAEVRADPVQLNTNLGYYTNFVNLLDLAGVAVPAGFRPNGLPFGVTLLGPAWSDAALLALGDRLHRALAAEIGVTGVALSAQPVFAAKPAGISLAVVGAHLSGQPLHHQLTSRKAALVKTCRTAANYRLFRLPGIVPPKPGLVRVAAPAGPGIEVEVWSLDEAGFGSFVAQVPPPMVIGTVELEDGTLVKSFLCEPFALEGAEEITRFGGWRAWLAAKAG